MKPPLIPLVLMLAVPLSAIRDAGSIADAQEGEGVISGVVIEDTNGNGERDAEDAGVQTLIQLVTDLDTPEAKSATLFSAEDGTFAFTDVPEGSYSLLVYWSAGFVRPVEPAHVSLVSLETGPNGGAEPLMFLVAESPEGLIPWPCCDASPRTSPVGTATVSGVFDRQRSEVKPPDTGSAGLSTP